ncbi:MAG TPA: chemotaxis response regulator protein-glutamate methylesterase [Treponema sp.]|nr:chemotaxis response regulator protein-glutamate methylesterase [Treponema sp.]HPC70633.1 chemotaxis response regulator protein-glutamate methylesterase [Treponema sp.]HRS03087.1 chemotaxis response regulator protein-glutamate methylesterase [Treponema sp.]HRU27881.1 chemotaxis response regulator protein-glutamate methylesterase [Treponema sp.]
MADEISVLIVDDSALMRNLISRMIEATPGLVIADRAMNGYFALQKLERCKPDVIVLDLEMPQMNGIEFLKERKRLGIDIPVIILSSIARRGAEITMEALALGASDFIMKPSDTQHEDIQGIKEHLTNLLLVYGKQYRQSKGLKEPAIPKKPLETEPPKIAPLANAPKPGPIEIIAIGISTGGPNALREVFAKLDKDLPAPIVVVQHMPPGFTEEFAKSLDKLCPLEVKEAAEGDIIKPGRILIAPGDKHIEVEKRPLATVVHLSDAPPVNGHRPSADVLFASVAKEFGNRAMGVIMTGMGKDGAKELGTILKAGGLTLGQDEVTSIVYGMPKVAWEMGHVMEQVPLSKMAERICTLAKDYQTGG